MRQAGAPVSRPAAAGAWVTGGWFACLAMAASARRSATPYLRSRAETWFSTVRTEMCRRPAIWRFDRCASSRARTSASRGDTDSRLTRHI
ncbi:hypothetical protein GCM10009555_095120 [Acrocarpospora macrocephala]|uniref:Uncharacterized protein n=1 Tax=Acrocarpospora macrocephala TaxID=150177 RepID=A0A5M3WTA4_9ACTN|nr:hypothetical protein Amac_050690 [Acrocarpospora macrocephala]